MPPRSPPPPPPSPSPPSPHWPGYVTYNMTASAAAFLTYASIRSPTVPLGAVSTAILCVLLPYSWRGLPRATYLCPSFLMAIAFLFVGTSLHFVMSALLPDTVVYNLAAQRFFEDAKRASVLFIFSHGAMTLIRLKYTLTKWQALIICEISKGMYIVFLLWGYSLAESELPSPAPVWGCMIAFVAILLALSCLRVFYVVRCRFDGERFNHVYFGSDSKCPMNRVQLMCMVCERNPDGVCVDS